MRKSGGVPTREAPGTSGQAVDTVWSATAANEKAQHGANTPWPSARGRQPSPLSISSLHRSGTGPGRHPRATARGGCRGPASLVQAGLGRPARWVGVNRSDGSVGASGTTAANIVMRTDLSVSEGRAPGRTSERGSGDGRVDLLVWSCRLRTSPSEVSQIPVLATVVIKTPESAASCQYTREDGGSIRVPGRERGLDGTRLWNGVRAGAPKLLASPAIQSESSGLQLGSTVGCCSNELRCLETGEKTNQDADVYSHEIRSKRKRKNKS